MKEIFTGIYNKVMGFFKPTETEESAKDVACNRLRVVLMQDRTNLTPELMERMRKELVELLSKYVEMDKDALELNLEQDGEQMALMLSIPVIRARDEEEIQKAIAQEEKATSSETEETETTEETKVEEDKESSQDEEQVSCDKPEECEACELQDCIDCEVREEKNKKS